MNGRNEQEMSLCSSYMFSLSLWKNSGLKIKLKDPAEILIAFEILVLGLTTPDGAMPHSSHTSEGLQVKTGIVHGMSFQQLTAAFSDSFSSLDLTENQRHVELMEYRQDWY